MIAEPDLTRLARTIGDPTRMRMLHLLVDGRALTAKELAYGVGVEPATGTAHLQKLLADSLVASRVQGRHKYFRLSSPQVAHCLEAMLAVARPAEHASEARLPLQEARFCYDHLAGRLAIELTQSLLSMKLLRLNDQEFLLTRKGERWCDTFGIDLARLRNSRRKFAPQCLDWSERKEHIGGALGAAIGDRFLQEGWIKRQRDSRAVQVTASGVRMLRTKLRVRWVGDHPTCG